MQQRRIKYFNILLHSFAVANKSLTGLLPEHVLQASDVGSPLDLLFVQIVIEVLHAIGQLAVLLPVPKSGTVILLLSGSSWRLPAA